MSMSYDAQLVVGLPKEQLEDFDNEDEQLESCGGWDCGGAGDIILGIEILSANAHSPTEVPFGLDIQIDEAKNEFKKLTGLNAQLYLTCGVC